MKIECTTNEFGELQSKQELLSATRDCASLRTSLSTSESKNWELSDKVSQLTYKVADLERQNKQLHADKVELQRSPSVNGDERLRYLSVGAREKMDNMFRFLANNQKINAIKAYRELTGLGLKESKDAIEILSNRLY